MSVAPDAQSLTTAAVEAASSGDFSSAARHLQLAADLQEAASSMPVELANTLNNLGVVYERLDRAADAERCYRRAYAVARAVLPADHLSVALSEKNLRDFCQGRGIPFEESRLFEETPARFEDAPAAPSPPAVARETLPAAVRVPPTKASSPRRAIVVGGIAVVAVGALALFGIRSFGTGDVPATPPASSATPSTAVSEPTPAAMLEPPEPAPAPRPEARPVPATPAPARPEPDRAVEAAVPTVVTAGLCSSLDTSGAEWQCAPPAGGPGTVFFYTRLAAPAATTVEHRWYREGRLHQTITLRIPPNPQRGYRTYSRIAIGAGRAGAWRAELRSVSGAILHEEQFSVVP
jgi:hypothetical protein